MQLPVRPAPGLARPLQVGCCLQPEIRPPLIKGFNSQQVLARHFQERRPFLGPKPSFHIVQSLASGLSVGPHLFHLCWTPHSQPQSLASTCTISFPFTLARLTLIAKIGWKMNFLTSNFLKGKKVPMPLRIPTPVWLFPQTKQLVVIFLQQASARAARLQPKFV